MDIDLGDLPNEALVAELDILRRQKADLEDRIKVFRDELAGRLRDVDWRYGDTLFRCVPQRTVKVSDPDGFSAWLGDHYRDVVPLTASTQIRSRALKRVCEERGVDPGIVEDTFFETSWGEPRLVEMPVAVAPVFAAKMRPGETRPKNRHSRSPEDTDEKGPTP